MNIDGVEYYAQGLLDEFPIPAELADILSECQLFTRVGTDTFVEYDGPRPVPPKPTLFENAPSFLAGSVKIEYLIHKLFEVFSLISITGPSGQYKSFIAICIACCVASGLPWNGMKVKQGAVLYLAGEGRSGIVRRVMAWMLKHGLVPADLALLYLSKSTLMMDGSNISQIVEEMKGVDVVLVIVDTLARHISGHENDALDMGTFVNALVTVCITENNLEHGQYAGSLEGWREEFYRLRRVEEGQDVKPETLKKAFQLVKGTSSKGGGLKDKGFVGFVENRGAVPLRLAEQDRVFNSILTNGVRGGSGALSGHTPESETGYGVCSYKEHPDTPTDCPGPETTP